MKSTRIEKCSWNGFTGSLGRGSCKKQAVEVPGPVHGSPSTRWPLQVARTARTCWGARSRQLLGLGLEPPCPTTPRLPREKPGWSMASFFQGFHTGSEPKVT